MRADLRVRLEALLKAELTAEAKLLIKEVLVDAMMHESMESEAPSRNESLSHLLIANQRLREALQAKDTETARLMASWRELRDLLRRLPVGIVVRRGNAIVFVNDVFLRAVGRSELDVKATPFSELVFQDERSRVLARIEHHSNTGETEPRGEMRWLVKGSSDPLVTEVELALDVQFEGTPAVMLVLRDVTDARNLNARLFIADRMDSVSTMASGMAHEINNPLSFVLANIGYADEQLKQVDPAIVPGVPIEDVREALSEANDGAIRVRDIVRDLKTFSSSGDPNAPQVDVHNAVEGAVRMLWNELRDRARVEKRFQRVAPVRATPGRLGQVFLNVLMNAATAIPPGHADRNEIAISIEQIDLRVIVEIRDTGVGMTRAQLGRIFDPFFTTKQAGVRRGLGLSLAYGIVTEAGGTIDVQSELGRGSSFRITLPAVSPVVLAHSPDDAKPASGSSEDDIHPSPPNTGKRTA